ncbi:hypothetical protein M0805_003850 [Coniferiporia weirii]|nr:hypothetical protein M0805_003850 [Coniferiporia weirii]
MGAGQSKNELEDEVTLTQTPVQFSQDVVNHLADAAAAPGPSLERQSAMDNQIRNHIQAELMRLQQEEQELRREIEVTLEKENLDYEVRATERNEGDTTEEAPSGDSQNALSSTVLLGDLEEVRRKVDKFHSNREYVNQNSAAHAADAVSSCYRNSANGPLDCWREVVAFKSCVAQMEQDYIASFQ